MPQRAFEQYHQAVYDFAYRLTGRQEVAEDITQECFLVLVRSPWRYDPARAGMKTFLFAIARNLALKEYRDRSGEQPLDSYLYMSHDPTFEPKPNQISMGTDRLENLVPKQ